MLNYHEHATGTGEDATAVAYVQLRVGADRTVYGVGLDPNIVTATLRAVVTALNRRHRTRRRFAPANRGRRGRVTDGRIRCPST